MTAINLFVDPRGRTHLFTDTGHYDSVTRRLVHLAPKAWPLEKYNAVMAWSGPAYAPHHLLEAIDLAGYEDFTSLLNGFPSLVRKLGVTGRYTAVLVDPQVGFAVEETGEVHPLWPGRFITSLPSPLAFDPDDVKGSAVALMESQRTSGVVFGQCLYYLIEPGRITVEELHDWRDTPSSNEAAATLAAKIAALAVGTAHIQDLSVDRIKIANGAVTDFVSLVDSGSSASNMIFNGPTFFGTAGPWIDAATISTSMTAAGTATIFVILQNLTTGQNTNIYVGSNTINGSGVRLGSGNPSHQYRYRVDISPNWTGGSGTMTANAAVGATLWRK